MMLTIIILKFCLNLSMMKSIIELVKTTQGFSIIQDGHEVNKVSGRALKQKQYSAPKKFTQQNFMIYPYVYCQENEEVQKYIILPAKSQWFNLNQVHEMQKKALPEWFKTKKVVFGAAKPDKFEKNQELYKKYRNYIIQLGRKQYVSPTQARKGLAGDVCSILRIHSFLQKNGLINYVFRKSNSREEKITQQALHRVQISNLNPKKRKDCIDKEKTIFEKHFDKDHLELLKKITKKYRPLCHLCQGICGVVWYQYEEQLILKQFEKVVHPKIPVNNPQNEERKQQARSEDEAKIKIVKADKSFKYLLRLCSSCYTSGNLPIVLSLDDFKKISILDNQCYQYQEPKQKRKINEQNKMIQMLQKNKFHLRKTAESLKMQEGQFYSQLLCIPIIKIEKLARIDPETEDQDESVQKIGRDSVKTKKEMQISNHVKAKEIKQQKSQKNLMQEYEREVNLVVEEQVKLYEQLVQLWLLKVLTKVTKLSDWQKSTNWFADRLINNQKNSLAEALKGRI